MVLNINPLYSANESRNGDINKMQNTPEISQLEDTYIEDLNMLGDWFLQYEYLLELSSELPHIPEKERNEKNKVHGCQSGVWLIMYMKDGKLHLEADSDALIVRGILAIIISLLNDRNIREIITYHPRFISETGLKEQISTDRFQGIMEVIKKIQNFAHKYGENENED